MGIRSGRVITARISVPDVANSFQVPTDIQYVLLRNDGANDVRFNFNDDDPSDYFTIKAGVTMPAPISVLGGETFNTDGVGGSSIIEIVAWG